ncbi:MAG: hypothetical protein WBM08_05620 [Prochlorococcaceae cyanobacterium]
MRDLLGSLRNNCDLDGSEIPRSVYLLLHEIVNRLEHLEARAAGAPKSTGTRAVRSTRGAGAPGGPSRGAAS